MNRVLYSTVVFCPLNFSTLTLAPHPSPQPSRRNRSWKRKYWMWVIMVSLECSVGGLPGQGPSSLPPRPPSPTPAPWYRVLPPVVGVVTVASRSEKTWRQRTGNNVTWVLKHQDLIYLAVQHSPLHSQMNFTGPYPNLRNLTYSNFVFHHN